MGKITTCGLYIVNDGGNILICHPTNHVPDFWTIPKGQMEEGESHLDAAIRETQEETNIDFTQIQKQIPWYYLGMTTYKSNKRILASFVCFEDEFPSKLGLNLNDVEIFCDSMVEANPPFPENDDFFWASFDQAERLLHEAQVPNLKEVKRLYLKVKKK